MRPPSRRPHVQAVRSRRHVNGTGMPPRRDPADGPGTRALALRPRSADKCSALRAVCRQRHRWSVRRPTAGFGVGSAALRWLEGNPGAYLRTEARIGVSLSCGALVVRCSHAEIRSDQPRSGPEQAAPPSTREPPEPAAKRLHRPGPARPRQSPDRHLPTAPVGCLLPSSSSDQFFGQELVRANDRRHHRCARRARARSEAVATVQVGIFWGWVIGHEPVEQGLQPQAKI